MTQGKLRTVPLSPTQKWMWLLEQLMSPAYNMPLVLRLTGSVDISVLERALQTIVDRHEVLRTNFLEVEGGEVEGVVIPLQKSFSLTFRDLHFLPETEREDTARRIAVEESTRRFDLAKDSLLRASLIRVSDQQHILVLTVHHSVCDDRSLQLLIWKLATVYEAYCEGRDAPNNPQSCQYADFVRWQNETLNPSTLDKDLAYWSEQFKTPPPQLSWPGSPPLPQSNQGSRSRLTISPPLSERLRALAQSQGLTLKEVLLTGLFVLLYRLTGVTDLCVATPTPGRDHPDSMTALGVFINTLALRLNLSDSPTFKEALHRVSRASHDAFIHRHLPFQVLVQEIWRARESGYREPIQVLYDHQEWALEGVNVGLMRIEPMEVETELARFDLNLSIVEGKDRVYGYFEYRKAVFAAPFIDRLCLQFTELLNNAVADPGRGVAGIDILPAVQRADLMRKAKIGAGSSPRHHTVHDLFTAVAKRFPNQRAVVTTNDQDSRIEQALTYGDLDRKSNQLANHLLDLGIGHQEPLALCLGRSAASVIGLLGALKAGAVYLPLDEQLSARTRSMLKDSATRWVLTQQHRSGLFRETGLRVIEWEHVAKTLDQQPDSCPPSGGEVDDLAYILFTSGSTGRPKGVMIPHAGLANLIPQSIRTFGIQPGDRLPQILAAAFDGAIWEIFVSLLSGATLFLAPAHLLPAGPSLSRWLRRHRFSFGIFTPSIIDSLDPQSTPDLKTLVIGAERLERGTVQRWANGRKIFNTYGVTECTINSTVHLCNTLEKGDPPIGQTLAGTELYLLDSSLELTPLGVAGEIFLGGVGIASGYVSNPDLTESAFIPHPFSAEPRARLYRTGDVARYREDGHLEFIGRKDRQIKLRGVRIELEEIESLAQSQSGVVTAAAKMTGSQPASEQVAVYYTTSVSKEVSPAALRDHLRSRLPDAIGPILTIQMETLPLTSSGKVDYSALPRPDSTAMAPSHKAKPLRSALEKQVAATWTGVLGVPEVDQNANFFDLGGHSLSLVAVQRKLEDLLGIKIPVVEMFRCSTISSLAQYLAERRAQGDSAQEEAPQEPSPDAHQAEDIAIIGMACRFPGASTIEQFWTNLKNGVESIHFYEATKHAGNVGDHVAAGGDLEEIESVDAAFFGLSPRQAELTDPQVRVFLECAWEALERAGYGNDHRRECVGVYAGAGLNRYLLNNLKPNLTTLDPSEETEVVLGNDKDFLTSLAAYKLNLKGPAVTVQTACSSSLVAVHLAMRALIGRECDIALAGGVSIRPSKSGYRHQEGLIFSRDGHTRAFDAEASGTVFTSGAGIVVLRRLADAQREGDHIHALIRGSAVNNDGASKVGYAASGVQGQLAVLRSAYACAGVNPASIDYVEAHGTATALGDPIEVAALEQVIGHHRSTSCAIGSVKTNIGHTDTAAGAAGLIKTVLALEHRQIPASLNFRKPNPRIDFSNSALFVNTELRNWPKGNDPRRAGVSSFGMGGSNAHVVLEEAPDYNPSGPSRPVQLVTLSAQSDRGLLRTAENLERYLREHDVKVPDLSYTLNLGRKAFAFRRSILVSNNDELLESLDTLTKGGSGAVGLSSEPLRVVFLFPGQGTQRINMGRGFYEGEAAFRQHVDRCCELLQPELDLDLRDLIYPASDTAREAAAEIQRTLYAQPSLFVVEYALAQLWMTWGITPHAMLGYSLGEYVAACLAGVFKLEEALTVVARRARLLESLPEGQMAMVGLPQSEVHKHLPEETWLAGVLSSSRCLIAGTASGIAQLGQTLKKNHIACIDANTSRAFHSPMVEPAMPGLEAIVEELDLREPSIPFVSNVSADWITVDQATSATYWGSQLREPVDFKRCLRSLDPCPRTVLLEVGNGNSLGVAAQETFLDDRKILTTGSLGNGKVEYRHMLEALGSLWSQGADVDWETYYSAERRHRISLPTYPFQRERHWVDPEAIDPKPLESALSEKPNITTISDRVPRCYLPDWRRTLPVEPLSKDRIASASWVVFGGSDELSNSVTEYLAEKNADVFSIVAANDYAEGGDRHIETRLDQEIDCQRVMRLARAAGSRAIQVIYLWPAAPQQTAINTHGHFWGLISLARAISHLDLEPMVSITTVVSRVFQVTGADVIVPERAAVLGPAQVIPQEYPGTNSRIIDVDLAGGQSPSARRLAAYLCNDAMRADQPEPIAYRGQYRFVRDFTPVVRAPTMPSTSVLVPQGVYLITGGLGGLGLNIARYLAKKVKGRLVLTTRSSFPPAGRRHGSGGPRGEILDQLRRIENLGTEVMVKSADVTDERQMREVFRDVRERFGKIDGIIHCAGSALATFIENTQADQVDRVMQAKTQGAQVLASLCKDEAPRFIAFCSSLASIAPRASQAAYCAANSMLDAYAEQGFPGVAKTISINWDAWQDTGMNHPRALQNVRRADWASTELGEHPLLQNYKQTKREVIFETRLDARLHWVLDEHHIDSKALMPGTAMVEMVLAGLAKLGSTPPIQLKHVDLVRPLIVAEGDNRLTRLRFALSDRNKVTGFVLESAQSRPPATWSVHARGQIDVLTSADTASPVNLDGVRARCQVAEPIRPSLRTGPRWDCISQVFRGKGEALAELNLASRFLKDLNDYLFHPGLADCALGFAPKTDDRLRLPFYYRRLCFYGRLENPMTSYARERLGQSTPETRRFDILVTDPTGNVLVEVEDASLRTIEEASFVSAAGEINVDSDVNGAGLIPEQATELLDWILAQDAHQILVSAGPLGKRLYRQPPQPDSEPYQQTTTQEEPKVEPADSDVADRLVQFVKSRLGVEPTGRETILELGGDSLFVFSVSNEIKQQFGVQVATPEMFISPLDTIAAIINRQLLQDR